MMNRLKLFVAPALVAFALGTLTAQPQPAPEVTADRDSLERIASSLEALVSLQKTTLMLQQVAMEERRIAPLKSDLRNAKSRVDAHNEELERMKSYLEQLDDRIAEAVRTGSEPDDALTTERTQVEEYLRLESEQRDATERRIMEMENDLARARRGLDILDERVQEILADLLP